MEKIGILGGTFNPVHNGHLRHALEAAEALGLEKVFLTPCKVPPHKAARGILPFDVRAGFIRQAIEGEPLLGLNMLEGEMEGPSYTYLSLEEWSKRHNGNKPWFLLGLEDFATLRSWYNGLNLWEKAHLVVVARGGGSGRFRRVCKEYWPGMKGTYTKGADGRALPQLVFKQTATTVAGPDSAPFTPTTVTFVDMPRLDISSTRVRQLALNGQSIRALVPDALVQAYTDADVLGVWRLAENKVIG